MALNKKKIKLLREFCDFCCEECKRHEDEVGTLEVHRIRRGNDGGKYELRNIKLLCKKCHKLIHLNEFSHISL